MFRRKSFSENKMWTQEGNVCACGTTRGETVPLSFKWKGENQFHSAGYGASNEKARTNSIQLVMKKSLAYVFAFGRKRRATRDARDARFVQGRIAPRRISSRMPWVWAESFPILFRNYTIINTRVRKMPRIAPQEEQRKTSAGSLWGKGGALLSPLVLPVDI